MRTLFWLLAVLALTAGTVWAQVAAPNLVPATSILSSPKNPAVLPWDRSRLFVGVSKLEFSDPTAPVDPTGEGEVHSLNARWVGETLAVGVDVFSASLDIDPTLGAVTVEVDSATYGVGAQFFGSISVGAGQFTEEIGGSGITTPEEEEITTYGATVRLGEILYLGAAKGTAHTVQGIGNEADQDETVLGLGALWRDGGSALHVEAFTLSRDLVTDPVSGRDEVDASGFAVEAIFSGLLLGYESTEGESIDSVGLLNDREETTTISVGWVPEEGLSIVVQQVEEDNFDGTGAITEQFALTAVSIGWMF